MARGGLRPGTPSGPPDQGLQTPIQGPHPGTPSGDPSRYPIQGPYLYTPQIPYLGTPQHPTYGMHLGTYIPTHTQPPTNTPHQGCMHLGYMTPPRYHTTAPYLCTPHLGICTQGIWTPTQIPHHTTYVSTHQTTGTYTLVPMYLWLPAVVHTPTYACTHVPCTHDVHTTYVLCY